MLSQEAACNYGSLCFGGMDFQFNYLLYQQNSNINENIYDLLDGFNRIVWPLFLRQVFALLNLALLHNDYFFQLISLRNAVWT